MLRKLFRVCVAAVSPKSLIAERKNRHKCAIYFTTLKVLLFSNWRGDYQNLDLDETNLTERIMHGVVRPNEHSRMLLWGRAFFTGERSLRLTVNKCGILIIVGLLLALGGIAGRCRWWELHPRLLARLVSGVALFRGESGDVVPNCMSIYNLLLR
jgi:hypothetical protein